MTALRPSSARTPGPRPPVSRTALRSAAPAHQAITAAVGSLVVSAAGVVLLPAGLWKPLLFMFLASALTINTYGFVDNFYLDPAAPGGAVRALPRGGGMRGTHYIFSYEFVSPFFRAKVPANLFPAVFGTTPEESERSSTALLRAHLLFLTFSQFPLFSGCTARPSLMFPKRHMAKKHVLKQPSFFFLVLGLVPFDPQPRPRAALLPLGYPAQAWIGGPPPRSRSLTSSAKTARTSATPSMSPPVCPSRFADIPPFSS